MKKIKKDIFLIFLLITLFFVETILFRRSIFTYKFNPNLIKKYLCSQDIPHPVPCNIVFLSDEDIYIATSYLFAKGEPPHLYNFEHPPLLKYLFGFSILLFNNPYYVQLILGIALIIVFYLLGLELFKNREMVFLSVLFLIIDPLFLNISTHILLDTGQTLFMLLYFYTLLKKPENYLINGIVLGLFAGAKFWVAPIFFIFFFHLYLFLKKKFDIKTFIYHLLIAFFVYSLTYLKSFIFLKGKFNILFHVLRVFKYRLHHNVLIIPGSSLIMFLTGFYKSWWEKKEIIRNP